MSPSTACSSVSACGSKRWKKHCTWAVWTSSEDRPRAAKPCRARPELARSRAALQHLLDQTPGAEDHLVKVEAGQLGKVRQLTLDDPGDAASSRSRAPGAYIRLISSTSSARADPS